MTNLLLVALMISAAEPDFRPETTDGAKPERRDATLDPKRLKPLPDLPLQKPSRIFGDSRFYTRTHNPAVAASPDGKWLVVGGTFFDRKTGKELFVDWLAASASRSVRRIPRLRPMARGWPQSSPSTCLRLSMRTARYMLSR